MKKSDYRTSHQAQKYNLYRFGEGLHWVDLDEKEIIKKYLRKASLRKPSHLLDLGAGTGRIIKELLAIKPGKIYALDSSSAMIQNLRENYPKEVKNGRVETLISYASQTPLRSNSIDLTTALHLFKHIKDLQPILSETHRVLKPGGYFIFDTLNKNSLVRFNLGTCFAVTESSLLEKLQNNGFSVKHVAYLHPLGETVYGFDGNLGAKLIDSISTAVSTVFPKLGTKIFVLALKR